MRVLLSISMASAALAPLAAFAQDGPAPNTNTNTNTNTNGGGDIIVTARQFEEARQSLFATNAASTYRLDRTQLDRQPRGDNTSLVELLTLTPGVTLDGYGSLHIRNDCTNMQYRLNGVVVPDSVGGIAHAFDPRVADAVTVLTGALPAQYGFRTAGVVDLTTRTGAFDQGGQISFYGGARGTVQPSAMIQGSSGTLNYFVSGSYLENDLGVENPTASRDAIHDRTQQYRAFAYVSKILSGDSRISAFGGTMIGHFEIPNNPGQAPAFTLDGNADFDSAQLDQREREITHYVVVPYEYAAGAFNFQVAPFLRYSQTRFLPDPRGGDLIFTGVSDDSRLSSLAAGLQADARYALSAAHTLRFGLFFQNERTRSYVTSRVFPVDANGNQSSDVPLTISENGGRNGQLYGVYLQDAWTLTPSLTLNMGLRFDAVRAYTREQQLSPRASLVWTPGKNTILHLSYARNFTPPDQKLVPASTLALYAGTTKGPEVTTADVVRAEREHYFDAGIQQTLLPGLNLGVSAYYKAKRNQIDEGQFGAALILTPFNYARGYTWGVEMSANYARGPVDLHVNVARGQQKARDIVSSQYFFSQEELAYIADHYIFTDHSQRWTASAGGSVRVRNGLGALIPSFSLNYGDGLRTEDPAGIVPNGAKLPSYVNVNLGISQAFSGPGVLKGLSIRLDVLNVFDTIYLIRDGQGVGVGAPQYGARRGVFMGLSKAF